MGTETPQRPRKEAAGSRHEPGLVRQTAPASTDPIGPQTQTLLEEVLRSPGRSGAAAGRALRATGVTSRWLLRRGGGANRDTSCPPSTSIATSWVASPRVGVMAFAPPRPPGRRARAGHVHW